MGAAGINVMLAILSLEKHATKSASSKPSEPLRLGVAAADVPERQIPATQFSVRPALASSGRLEFGKRFGQHGPNSLIRMAPAAGFGWPPSLARGFMYGPLMPGLRSSLTVRETREHRNRPSTCSGSESWIARTRVGRAALRAR